MLTILDIQQKKKSRVNNVLTDGRPNVAKTPTTWIWPSWHYLAAASRTDTCDTARSPALSRDGGSTVVVPPPEATNIRASSAQWEA